MWHVVSIAFWFWYRCALTRPWYKPARGGLLRHEPARLEGVDMKLRILGVDMKVRVL
jgi:hypothetical protein